MATVKYPLERSAVLNGKKVNLYLYDFYGGLSFPYDYTVKNKLPDGTTETEYVYPGSAGYINKNYNINIEVDDSMIRGLTLFCLEEDETFFKELGCNNLITVGKQKNIFKFPGDRRLSVYMSDSKIIQSYEVLNGIGMTIASMDNLKTHAVGLIKESISVYHRLSKFIPPYTQEYAESVTEETGLADPVFSVSGIFAPVLTRRVSHDEVDFIQCGYSASQLDFKNSSASPLRTISRYGSYPMDFFKVTGSNSKQKYRLSLYNGSPSISFTDDSRELEIEEQYKIFNTVKFLDWFWNYDSDELKFSVYADCGNGGNISFDKDSAPVGDAVTITVMTDAHYVVDSIKAYNTTTNAEIMLQELSNQQSNVIAYNFIMPEANVYINVKFRFIGVTVPVIVKYTSNDGKLYTTSIELLRDEQIQSQTEGEQL